MVIESMFVLYVPRKQGRINHSISQVRAGRGSMASGQWQQLKSTLPSALNAGKREVIMDRPTDRPTN